MIFHVLGCLEVRISGRRVGISAPKQKAVLATLVLEINNEVAVDRLVRYVWDGAPPPASHTTLQSYIYRLRQLLRPMAGVSLETSSSGYMLQANPFDADLWYFRHQILEAQQKVSAGNLDEALKGFRSGLSVWRGRALAGVPG